jgi:hypothetical protein
MKKRTILLFLFLNVVLVFVAQNPDLKRTNHWYFGNGAGLDFSSGSPVAVTDGKLHTSEGSAVMSDTAGNLLFYTDGDTIWNKNHLPMLNGTGLFGCGNYGSTAQAALIVPKPQNDSIYYVFTNDCFENQGVKGFRYSVVNIYLDNGLGSVVSKNNMLFSPSTEALSATRDSSGNGYWIMTHGYNTNNFYAFHLTNFGLDTVPVVSSTGLIANSYFFGLKFSPNGKKIAVANPNIYQIDQLFDFNSNNGMVYNLINLTDGFIAGNGYNLSFSSDNSKLYYVVSGSYIYQYCLAVPQDSISISSTVSMVKYNPDNSTFSEMQMSLDGKIMIASIYKDSISYINSPNMLGNLCDVRVKEIFLETHETILGLPNFVQSFFEDLSLQNNSCDSILDAEEISFFEFNLSIFPNPGSDKVTIKINSETLQNELFDLQIISDIGVNMYQTITNEKIIEVNTSNFSSGIYIISINCKNKFSRSYKIAIHN